MTQLPTLAAMLYWHGIVSGVERGHWGTVLTLSAVGTLGYCHVRAALLYWQDIESGDCVTTDGPVRSLAVTPHYGGTYP